MSVIKEIANRRRRRKYRVKSKISGTAERPRLSVSRSARNLYCQIINDDTGETLMALSTLCSAFVESHGAGGGNIAAAKHLGKLAAVRANENGISKIVFDRAGYKYHGRVKAFAESLREGGLSF